MIDLERDRLAHLQRARLDHAVMEEQAVQLLLRVLDGEARALGARDHAAVADLAAGFGIERRLVDDDDAALALLQRFTALAVLDQRHDLARRRFGLVAEELRRADLLPQLEPERLGRGLAGAGPGLPRLRPLALHGGGEALRVDPDAARPSARPRSDRGEAVGVVELEGDLAGSVSPRFRPLVSSSSSVRPRSSVSRKRVSSSLNVSVIRLWPRSSSG